MVEEISTYEILTTEEETNKSKSGNYYENAWNADYTQGNTGRSSRDEQWSVTLMSIGDETECGRVKNEPQFKPNKTDHQKFDLTSFVYIGNN